MTPAERALAELVAALDAAGRCGLCLPTDIAHDECHSERIANARAQAAKVLRAARPESRPN